SRCLLETSRSLRRRSHASPVPTSTPPTSMLLEIPASGPPTTDTSAPVRRTRLMSSIAALLVAAPSSMDPHRSIGKGVNRETDLTASLFPHASHGCDASHPCDGVARERLRFARRNVGGPVGTRTAGSSPPMRTAFALLVAAPLVVALHGCTSSQDGL